MRIAIISAAVMAAISFTVSAADLSQAQANYQHADRMSSSTHASINSVAWQNGDGRATKQAEQTAKSFGAARAQAAADLKSAEMHAARINAVTNSQKTPPAPKVSAPQKAAAPQPVAQVAVVQATPPAPKAPAAVAVAAPQMIAQAMPQKAPPAPAAPTVAAPQITGTTYRAAVVADQAAALAVKAPALPAAPTTPAPAAPAAAPTPAAPVQPTAIVNKPTNSTINVAASSLKPSTPVQTPQGVVTAGSLPPETQVSLPIDSVFSAPAKKGGHDRNNRSTSRGGTGNGSQNAANSRSGVAHGFGDNHVGGGHAQSGSKNVGHW